ncbi:hypothetical protein ROZALSC1DRAFT_21596 [Rozella allomycis CSF55]|uniref:PH domain-containing protein n=1 Tax=Rozella allomycis (strain CSF55) TaxID=988480 RepID=A0A4V1J039_ROZAC|nr:hypothetical protein ROZALSC1DRAFT_21596 [Rozella allomycis CSF55]
MYTTPLAKRRTRQPDTPDTPDTPDLNEVKDTEIITSYFDGPDNHAKNMCHIELTRSSTFETIRLLHDSIVRVEGKISIKFQSYFYGSKISLKRSWNEYWAVVSQSHIFLFDLKTLNVFGEDYIRLWVDTMINDRHHSSSVTVPLAVKPSLALRLEKSFAIKSDISCQWKWISEEGHCIKMRTLEQEVNEWVQAINHQSSLCSGRVKGNEQKANLQARNIVKSKSKRF